MATPLGMMVMLFLFDWRFGLICLLPVILGFALIGRSAIKSCIDDFIVSKIKPSVICTLYFNSISVA